MKITIDIPKDIEKSLLKKCEEMNISPSEFVISLLEWYFFKRKTDISSEIADFVKFAKRKGIEKAKNCKYSDGKFCALEIFTKLDIDAEPQLIDPLNCLFCTYFVGKDVEEKRKLSFEDAEKVYNIAKLAAKLVIEIYGDQLGYRPKMKLEQKEIKKDDLKKLLENW
uniref:Uncharacterized protein n=1 Tax=Geoglobus ahangari TaxID=113653 RepID=A0A7C4S678_9EURY